MIGTTRISLSAAAVVGLILTSGEASAQTGGTRFDACYHPSVGLVYRVNEPGLPAGCLDPSHVPCSP